MTIYIKLDTANAYYNVNQSIHIVNAQVAPVVSTPKIQKDIQAGKIQTATKQEFDYYTMGLAVPTKKGVDKNDMFEIAKGNVAGARGINKWGKVSGVGTGTSPTSPQVIWDGGGVYTPPKADRIHQIVSNSAQDKGVLRGNYTSTSFGITSFIDANGTFITDNVSVGDVVLNDTIQDHSIVVAIVSEQQLTVKRWHHSEHSNVGDSFRIVGAGGTGAIVAHIKIGYKEDGTELTEFVVLNGITNVPTTMAYYRATRMHTHGAGSNKTNVGTITMTADVDATVTLQINPNNGQTEMCFVHVPMGSTGFLKQWKTTIHRTGAAKEAMVDMELRSQLWGVDGEVLSYGDGVSVYGTAPLKFDPAKPYTQGTDVWARCVGASDNDTIIKSGMDFVIVKNTNLK